MDSNMKILVVDDFSTMRQMSKKLLLDLGFKNIVDADNGQTALSLLKSCTVDFVITDWKMPHMCGLDLLKKMRADESLKHIPVLLVSGVLNRNEISEAMDAGGNGYIVKPFTSTLLKEKIQRIFQSHNDTP
jgi:two-component system chemotaxis response regulator CheY